MKSVDPWRYHINSHVITHLFVQVKFVLSEKLLDNLANPHSLGNKTALYIKIEHKVSSFLMTYKQDVTIGIK